MRRAANVSLYCPEYHNYDIRCRHFKVNRNTATTIATGILISIFTL